MIRVLLYSHFLLKEIKLTSLRWSAQEDAADEDDALGIAVAKVKTKVISQIIKKNVIENIVPIIIAMKHLVSLILNNN